MSRPDQIEIERWRYWQGQELRGRDFRDQLTSEAHLRWWHNRAMHNAYGVRYGFRVQPVFEAEELAAAGVECGVAYDCYGRELILQSTREVNLPPAATPPSGTAPASMTLLVRYRGMLGRRGVSGACAPCGSAVVLEEPEFLWRPSARVSVSDGVALAEVVHEPAARLAALPAGVDLGSLAGRVYYESERRLLISRGVLSGEDKTELLNLSSEATFQTAVNDLASAALRVPVLDFRPRVARPLARPRVGSGATVPEGTAWEPWTERVSDTRRTFSEAAVGYQVTIDTSAAGFTETPCYFAWLEGTFWEAGRIEFLLAPFTHVDQPTPRQFRFRLWLPTIPALLGSRARAANLQHQTEFINFARRQRLYVCWLGVGPNPAGSAAPGCGAATAPECYTANED